MFTPPTHKPCYSIPKQIHDKVALEKIHIFCFNEILHIITMNHRHCNVFSLPTPKLMKCFPGTFKEKRGPRLTIYHTHFPPKKFCHLNEGKYVNMIHCVLDKACTCQIRLLTPTSFLEHVICINPT